MNVSLSSATSNPYPAPTVAQNAGGARPTRGPSKAADNDGDADDKASGAAASATNASAAAEGGSGLNVLA